MKSNDLGWSTLAWKMPFTLLFKHKFSFTQQSPDEHLGIYTSISRNEYVMWGYN